MGTRRYTLTGMAGMIVLIGILLASCSGGGSSSGAGGMSGSGGTDSGGDSSGDIAMTEDMPSASEDEVMTGGQESGAMASAEPSSGGASVPESGAAGRAQSTEQALPEEYGRKIVKTANLGIRSEDVRGSAAEAQQIAASFSGTVLNSQVSQDSGRKDAPVYASMVLSVPSQEFENALAELRGIGRKVTDDSVAGQDVTEEFVDLESRERNLLAAERSLLDLYDRAESVDDTLYIQRELTAVRGEIELVQGRIQYLEDRTAFSQITLSIQPVAAPTPPAKTAAWDPGAVAARAWAASLSVLQGAATVAISAAVFGWWLIPVILIGLAWWRRRNRETGQATGS